MSKNKESKKLVTEISWDSSNQFELVESNLKKVKDEKAKDVEVEGENYIYQHGPLYIVITR